MFLQVRNKKMTLKVPLSSFLNQGLKPLGNDSFGSVL